MISQWEQELNPDHMTAAEYQAAVAEIDALDRAEDWRARRAIRQQRKSELRIQEKMADAKLIADDLRAQRLMDCSLADARLMAVEAYHTSLSENPSIEEALAYAAARARTEKADAWPPP